MENITARTKRDHWVLDTDGIPYTNRNPLIRSLSSLWFYSIKIGNGAGYNICMWAAAGTAKGRTAPTQRVEYKKIIVAQVAFVKIFKC